MTAVHTKLGEICIVRRGTTITKKQTIEGEVPVIGGGTKPTYFHNESNRKANCITISGSGASAGFVNKWDVPIFASDCTTVEPKDNTQLSKFVYYFLLSQQEYIYKNFRSGAAQSHVYAKDIETLEYPILPISEQERIVAKLDAAFAEIDEAVSVVEAKETEVQQLKTSLLSSSLNGDALIWKTVKLSDVCQIQPKKAQVKARLKDSDEVSFMPMKDLGIQTMYPKSTQIKKLEKVYNSYTYFEDNDILLAKITPCFENGKLGIASKLINGVGFGSSEYIVLRCSEKVSPQYIYFCLNQPSFRITGKNQMSGAVGHKRVPLEYVENTKIYLPPIADQERIVAKLDTANFEFRNVYESIAKSKANFHALKSSILHQELQSIEVA